MNDPNQLGKWAKYFEPIEPPPGGLSRLKPRLSDDRPNAQKIKVMDPEPAADNGHRMTAMKAPRRCNEWRLGDHEGFAGLFHALDEVVVLHYGNGTHPVQPVIDVAADKNA